MIKIVLVFAALAFAVHAFPPMDTTDYCSGFAREANLTDVQTQDCITCLESDNSIDWIEDDLFDITDININSARDVFFYAVYPKEPYGVECQPHVNNLQAIYSANKTTDQFLKTIELNIRRKLVPLLLGFADWRVEEAKGDGYQFGNKEAHLLGLASGIESERPHDGLKHYFRSNFGM